jgi:hypothetical protein
MEIDGIPNITIAHAELPPSATPPLVEEGMTRSIMSPFNLRKSGSYQCLSGDAAIVVECSAGGIPGIEFLAILVMPETRTVAILTSGIFDRPAFFRNRATRQARDALRPGMPGKAQARLVSLATYEVSSEKHFGSHSEYDTDVMVDWA